MRHKVLIAGNDTKSLMLIRKILEIFKGEFSVITAFNRDVFRNITRKGIADLIILNFDDLVNDSIPAIFDIRNNKLTKHTPVLVATGFHSGEVQQAIAAGADDFIRSPLERVEMMVRIRYLLKRYRMSLENLAQSRELEKMSLVADRSENSVLITDSNGEIEWVNKAFEKLYEYTFDEFCKQYGGNLGKVSPRFSEALNKCREGKTWVVYENFWATGSGQKKWIQTSLTPVLDPEFRITNFIAIETDITSLKLAQEKLIDQNQDLRDLTTNLEQINKKLEEQQEEIIRQRKQAEEQKALADQLLYNIFPYEIAEQLKNKGVATPKHYRLVSIMFTDFVGFSKLSEQLSIHDLIRELSMYFEKFDEITRNHYIEKIKTIGDSYMCAGGLPIRNKSNPLDTVLAALEIQKFINDTNRVKKLQKQPLWNIRLGIHTGEVIAGVIGKSKMAYDIWGDAVNTASRMESCGETNKINISGSTYRHVCKYFNCSYRGKVGVRNIGEIDMYFVEGLKQEYRSDNAGFIPNRQFRKILSGF